MLKAQEIHLSLLSLITWSWRMSLGPPMCQARVLPQTDLPNPCSSSHLLSPTKLTTIWILMFPFLIKQGFMLPRLVLNLLCSCGYLWRRDPPASQPFLFWGRTSSAAQAGFDLRHQPPKCWDYKCAPYSQPLSCMFLYPFGLLLPDMYIQVRKPRACVAKALLLNYITSSQIYFFFF